jgi:hypothetical protein
MCRSTCICVALIAIVVGMLNVSFYVSQLNSMRAGKYTVLYDDCRSKNMTTCTIDHFRINGVRVSADKQSLTSIKCPNNTFYTHQDPGTTECYHGDCDKEPIFNDSPCRDYALQNMDNVFQSKYKFLSHNGLWWTLFAIISSVIFLICFI